MLGLDIANEVDQGEIHCKVGSNTFSATNCCCSSVFMWCHTLSWRWARRTLDTHGCHMRKKKTCAFTFPSLTCPVLSQILRARQGHQEVLGYCCQIFGIYWYFSRITALQIIQKPAGYKTASNPLGNRKWQVGVFFGKSFVLLSSVCFIQIQRTSQNRR